MIIIGLQLLTSFRAVIFFNYILFVKKVMLVYYNSRYPRIQRKHKLNKNMYRIPRYKKIHTFKTPHLCSMHMTKRFHCMKVVENFISKNPPLTNNLCYPRIKKKLMFCETSDQHLLANMLILSHV